MGWVRLCLTGFFLSFTIAPQCSFGAIINEDDREAVTYDTTTFSAIGRVKTVFYSSSSSSLESQSHCTGTLVSDDIVLTAAHCFVDPFSQGVTTDLEVDVTFCRTSVSLGFEECARATRLHLGTGDPYSRAGKAQDVAFIRLTHPLGRTFGPIPIKRIRSFHLDQTQFTKINLSAYSLDFQKGRLGWIHRGCNVLGHPKDGSYIHDCDTSYGASGAPILKMDPNQQWVLLGMHVRSSSLKQLILDGFEFLSGANVPSVGNEAIPVNAINIHYQNALEEFRRADENE